MRNRAQAALDSDLDAIADTTAHYLTRGLVAYGTDGDPVGVTYFDYGTRGWYAAPLDDCRALLTDLAAGEPDAYSHWCARLDGLAATQHATAVEAAEALL